MKQITHLTQLTLTLILAILIIPTIQALTLTNDNYAVETVLNKPETSYNIYGLDRLERLIVSRNKYIAPSEYNPNLAVILSEEFSLTTGKQKGLSVRLQLPTKNQETSTPYIRFISLIDNLKLESKKDFYQAWEVLCSSQQCTLKKQETELIIQEISKNRYEITIESKIGLVPSTTGASCFSKYGNTLCITTELKSSLAQVLPELGLTSFNELLTSYNLINVGYKSVNTLAPASTLSPDWKEAMKQELVRLKRQNIIDITDTDIEEISNLTEQGKAGRNFRIVYDDNINSYNYYFKTQTPILTQELNSEPFVFPIQKAEINPIANPYYLIPLIITIVLFFVFSFMIILAKVISKRKVRHSASS